MALDSKTTTLLKHTKPTNGMIFTSQMAGIRKARTRTQSSQYSIGLKYSNQTGKFENDVFTSFTLFGPPNPGQKQTYLPVLFTEPYFDCGRSNRWIVSAVSPLIDQVPRYLDWFHLRRMTYVKTNITFSRLCLIIKLVFSLFDILHRKTESLKKCKVCRIRVKLIFEVEK